MKKAKAPLVILGINAKKSWGYWQQVVLYREVTALCIEGVQQREAEMTPKAVSPM